MYRNKVHILKYSKETMYYSNKEYRGTVQDI